MLDGTYTDQYLQVGANDDQGISVTINKTDWTAPTVTGGAAGSGSTLLKDNIDEAIKSVTTERCKLGAIQNRLEYTVKVDDNTAENMQAAESRIRDTDMAGSYFYAGSGKPGKSGSTFSVTVISTGLMTA